MTLPLYENNGAPTRRPQDAHTGLWYDKFCNLHPEDDKKNRDEKGKDPWKSRWIETVVGQCGDQTLIAEATERMAKLLEAHGQEPLFYKTTSRFVTGLGREHPVENGFAWHPTLGVAYWPGSSVKGLVRAWAEQWADPKPSAADVQRIFGPTADELKQDKSLAAHIGSVIFLDALPNGPVTLEKDVMTPHYQPYYQGDEPPADWHSPNPVPFLVVGAGQKFVFGLLPRKKASKASEDCEQAATWLTAALMWLGAGAKTAVGYGRFEDDDSANKRYQDAKAKREKEAQQEAQLNEMSDLAREMHADHYDDPQKFPTHLVDKWIPRLEKAKGEDACEIARLLADWYQKHNSKNWDNPRRGNIARVELIKEKLATCKES